MPLRRTAESGFFTTRFKEDAFFLDFSDRALLFNSGARTEQSYQLPFYFIEEGYHMRQRMIESLGFTGAGGRLELYIQYPLLPVIDQKSLEGLRQEVLKRANATRASLVARQEHQALLDMFMLGLCDEPLVFFEYNRPDFSLHLKARAPIPENDPVAARTKRGRLNFYREYEDLLCSKAAFYLVSAFENLPFVQQIELTLYRMETSPVKGLVVIEEPEEQKPETSLRRVDLATLPPPQTAKERKALAKALKQQEKEQAQQLKNLSKEKKRVAVTQRDPDPFDELFDGTLAHWSALLSARIPRQGFMDLQKSKLSYSARRAMELFELRLDTDEEAATIGEIESFIEDRKSKIEDHKPVG
jgi:hypothetical protein